MSRYVVLDGPDGCGKSSQARALCESLGRAGRRVHHVREPGSTPVGEALRQLLLSPKTGALQPITEALLFSAARAETVAQVVAKALAAGEFVVAERGYLSTVVYQALAAEPGLDLDWVFDLQRRVHGPVLPDVVVVLDVPPAVAASRRQARVDDRIEARGAAYHERVRDGFLRAAALEPRAVVVDASRPFAVVQDELRALVARLPS
ncbi:MAG: dTMP kinase [Planctomycetes bacterium]|nr:dTMP kinase [Planctomycetota bacterium]